VSPDSSLSLGTAIASPMQALILFVCHGHLCRMRILFFACALACSVRLRHSVLSNLVPWNPSHCPPRPTYLTKMHWGFAADSAAVACQVSCLWLWRPLFALKIRGHVTGAPLAGIVFFSLHREPGLAMLPGVAGGAGFEEGRFAKVPGFESLAAMFFGGPAGLPTVLGFPPLAGLCTVLDQLVAIGNRPGSTWQESREAGWKS